MHTADADATKQFRRVGVGGVLVISYDSKFNDLTRTRKVRDVVHSQMIVMSAFQADMLLCLLRKDNVYNTPANRQV